MSQACMGMPVAAVAGRSSDVEIDASLEQAGLRIPFMFLPAACGVLFSCQSTGKASQYVYE